MRSMGSSSLRLSQLYCILAHLTVAYAGPKATETILRHARIIFLDPQGRACHRWACNKDLPKTSIRPRWDSQGMTPPPLRFPQNLGGKAKQHPFLTEHLDPLVVAIGSVPASVHHGEHAAGIPCSPGRLML